MNVGSLQAAQAIASSIKSLLGPSQSTKCCVNGEDDRDSIICSSAAKIFQYLEVEHPVGYIINDACQAMYKTDGCGCKTLVCMIGFWSRSALTLQHEGVPVSIISKLFDEALSNCLQVLEEIALPIQETVCKRGEYGDVSSSIQNSSHEDFSSSGSKPSRFIIENVWMSTEADFNDTVHTGKNGSLPLSVSMGDNENKRKTENMVPTLPKSNAANDNKRILVTDSQCCLGIRGNLPKESLMFGDTVEDDFDSCFDDLPISGGTTHRKHVNKESEDVCKSASSSEQIAHKNNVKPVTNISTTNKSEIKRMDLLLKDLSFLGQKVTSPKVSTGKQVSEILKSCRNLSIDFPKTQREKECCQAQDDPQGNLTLDSIEKGDLKRLGIMLSHGKDKMMALAVEVIFHQISSRRKTVEVNRFDVDENAINIERIVGATSGHSQVVSGILLRQKVHLVGHLPLVALRVALVNGDITEEFRHAGFKDSFQTKRVFSKGSYLSTSNTSWLQKIVNVLRTLKIGVVIAKGNIDKDLEDSCQAMEIQTFSGISAKTFQLLSHSLNSTAVVYLSDLKECHVGKPVCLHPWNGPQPQLTNNNGILVVLQLAESKRDQTTVQQSGRLTKNMKESIEEQEPLQTVLLCGPSEQLVMDLELAFWKCVFSLRNTINCRRILPGAGRTEITCIQKLRKISEDPNDLKPSQSSSWLQRSLSSYRPVVYTAFADGLVEFLINLLSNSGCMMNYGHAHTVIQEVLDDHDQLLSGCQYPLVADDFIAKKNAWSKAKDVVCLMLQSDVVIVTGGQASTN